MKNTSTQKIIRVADDKELLKKLVYTLETGKQTKKELADKLNIDAKKLNASVLLAAVIFSGKSKFLDNLIEKKAYGRVKKSSQYNEKTGLKIQPWQFKGKNVADGQRYTIQFGRTGIITLRPTEEEDIDVGSKEE